MHLPVALYFLSHSQMKLASLQLHLCFAHVAPFLFFYQRYAKFDTVSTLRSHNKPTSPAGGISSLPAMQWL